MRSFVLLAAALGCGGDASTVLTLELDLGDAAGRADALVTRVTLADGDAIAAGMASEHGSVAVSYEDGALVLTIADPASEESVSLEPSVSGDRTVNVLAQALSGGTVIAEDRRQARIVQNEWWRVALELVCIEDGCAVPSDAGPDAPSYELPTIDLSTASGASLVIQGAGEGDSLHVLATGDLNDDDELDFVVGAPNADAAPVGELGDVGNAYVILGGDDLPDEIALDDPECNCFIQIFGVAAGDRLGTSLAIGQFDDDDFDDLAMGAPGSAGPGGKRAEAGEVLVLRGEAFSGSSVPDTFDVADLIAASDPSVVRITGRAGDRAGTSIAFGQLAGSAVDELLIGAPGNSGPTGSRTAAGAVYVMFGSAAPSMLYDLDAGEYDLVLFGLDGMSMGQAVVFGNVNDDSFADMVVGAPGGVGAVYTILGRGDFPSDLVDLAEPGGAVEPEWRIVGPGAGASFGYALAVDDLDAANGQDVAVGAPTQVGDGSGEALAGAVYAFTGNEALTAFGEPIETGVGEAIVVRGEGCEQLGYSLAAGDRDGDDMKDVVAGAPLGAGGAGRVLVFSGAGQGLLQVLGIDAASTTDCGLADGSRLGFSVGAGRLGGETPADLLLGSPGYDPAREDAGGVFLILDGEKGE